MRAILTLASIAGAATLLAGCGAGNGTAADPVGATGPTHSSSAPSPTASHAVQLPACSSIWKVGASLPSTYRGCQDNGVKARSFIFHCEIGSSIATYGDDLYAVPGRTVVKASPSRNADKKWKYVYNHCVG